MSEENNVPQSFPYPPPPINQNYLNFPPPQNPAMFPYPPPNPYYYPYSMNYTNPASNETEESSTPSTGLQHFTAPPPTYNPSSYPYYQNSATAEQTAQTSTSNKDGSADSSSDASVKLNPTQKYELARYAYEAGLTSQYPYDPSQATYNPTYNQAEATPYASNTSYSTFQYNQPQPNRPQYNRNETNKRQYDQSQMKSESNDRRSFNSNRNTYESKSNRFDSNRNQYRSDRNNRKGYNRNQSRNTSTENLDRDSAERSNTRQNESSDIRQNEYGNARSNNRQNDRGNNRQNDRANNRQNDRSNNRQTERSTGQSSERSYDRRTERSYDRQDRNDRDRYNNRSRYNKQGKSRSGSPERYRRQQQEPADPNTSEKSERDIILERYRKNYCATSEDVSNKLEEYSKMTQDEIIKRERRIWTRTTPADLYYVRDETNSRITRGTQKLYDICKIFKSQLVDRAAEVNARKPTYEPPQRKKPIRICKHKSEVCHSDSSSNDGFSEEEENIMEELTRKQQHPDRLHPEMWYNDPGEMNDGPLCRCSLKSRKSGIRHGIYAGEQFLTPCDKDSNNATKLYHYKITISPPTNFLIKTPTIIKHDEHEFIFEGFSMFSHFPLFKLPTCKVIRFNIEYTILYIKEKHPDNFTIRELDLFHDYLFREILELVDLDLHAAGDTNGCSQFHFMPRFVRDLPDNGREILSMKEVLMYLLFNSNELMSRQTLKNMPHMSQYEWQAYADEVKGMVVTYPGKKPCSVRVDQLDRNTEDQDPAKPHYPEIVHFGIRPPQLSYAGNPEYQKAWRDYVKFRHLLANMSKPSYDDKRKLEAKEAKLQEMRTQSRMKRDVTVAVSAEGFYRTGIMCDIVQHAMLIPVLVCHLRFHHSLNVLEESIGYKFHNRALLQLALTHPSYRENFGTNPDHARNSLTNCGIRQPEYGDRRIHYMNTRKRGINTLINIMSRFGKKQETESNITHNERLEFLGDAVVEFLSSIHLFLMFPELEEGGLATYRAAIVQNQHLAVLARVLNLDQFMLYAHGSDLCHDLELRHAMANCFEALMGALFLDGGIEIADKVFGRTFFKDEPELLEIWENLPPHPLQEQEPNGDRQWISKFDVLQKLTKFEDSIGIKFNHIRLLARAFTDRSIGYTNLTLGSNQRLEFLGDTVLQLIASEYLYKYFPEHHEGHLSLLRSSLVNNRTQAVVCDDLGMANYAVYNNPKAELKTKDRADLLEAFIGALYIDQDIEYCRKFCQVTLFPRLQDFIMNQDWNDPKSKLQQCCLTLRTMDGGEPDIPVYKVIECKGPTNTRVYTVAVYFRNKRLAKATGHSIQQAEMNAAKQALEMSSDLFPQLDHQKRVIAKSMLRQKQPNVTTKSGDDRTESDSSRSRTPDRFRNNQRNNRNRRNYRSYSKSPNRGRSGSSDRRGSKTPDRYSKSSKSSDGSYSRSSNQRYSKTPDRRYSRTPDRRYSRTPDRRYSRTSDSNSPDRNTPNRQSNDSDRNRSTSIDRSRSKSTDRFGGRNRSKSMGRNSTDRASPDRAGSNVSDSNQSGKSQVRLNIFDNIGNRNNRGYNRNRQRNRRPEKIQTTGSSSDANRLRVLSKFKEFMCDRHTDIVKEYGDSSKYDKKNTTNSNSNSEDDEPYYDLTKTPDDADDTIYYGPNNEIVCNTSGLASGKVIDPQPTTSGLQKKNVEYVISSHDSDSD